MFISTKYSGYNRRGEQSAAGRFLILLQPNWNSTKYPQFGDTCRECGVKKDIHLTFDGPDAVKPCSEHGVVARLRRINELPRASEMTDEERDAVVNEIMAEKFVSGCFQCAAYKRYKSVCRQFAPASNKWPLRAIVRYARLRQCGHYMMGTAKIGKHRIILSGSYGGDGLPKSVPDEVYEAGVELPRELYDAWNTGGGWNSAGSEAPAMRTWALDTFRVNGRTR